MLLQVDHSTMIFSLIGLVFTLNMGMVGIMLGLRRNDQKEFEDHKKTVQYKDTCAEVVKRIDEKMEERHKMVTTTLNRIEGLVRNGHG